MEGQITHTFPTQAEALLYQTRFKQLLGHRYQVALIVAEGHYTITITRQAHADIH